VKPFDFPLLADENIHPDVISFLRRNGHEIQSLSDRGSLGLDDDSVMEFAYQEKRVILTHDSDFGRLAITQGQAFVGIIYLRPGHIRSEFTLETLRAVETRVQDVMPPFILVAERSGKRIHIRIRRL
jgi:predicted nuclease of predicted toxin-antitoxin system